MFRKIICSPIVLLSIVLLGSPIAWASDNSLPEGLSYEVRKDANHVIHILTIDPTRYQLKLVKAHNQVFGRETVPAIATRTNATAAINAGFFEIGNSDDGRPSGTLMIDGKLFSLAKNNQAFLELNDNNINMGNVESNFKLKTDKITLSPDAINQFAKNKEIVFYNHTWGPTSLTPYDRQEVLIDKNLMITDIVKHGDNAIPEQGWILSFPNLHKLPPFKVGQKVALDVQWQGAENVKNMVMGIPLLVKDGQIVADLDTINQKNFVELPHARTAVGVQPNGTIVMVVAEHEYKQPLRDVTLEQAQNILRDKKYPKEKLVILTMPEIRSILEKELVSTSNVIGLSLPDLAKLMVDLKCVQAINLDGGGSSTLFLDGQVKNIAVGDTDEAMGQKTVRPVSNAIVVVKRN